MPFLTEEMYQNLVRGVDASAPESVHLCDFPAYDPALADEALLRDMAVVIRVVELGREARTRAEIRVRQPLARMLVHTPTGEAGFAALGQFEDQILDELNVKAIMPMERPEEYINYEIRPNLPLIGKKYGKLIPRIRTELEGAGGEAIRAMVEAGMPIRITLGNGEHLDLYRDEVLINVRQHGGYAVREDGEYVVALETDLTPELRREGLARDFVRFVQEARKTAGLRVEDHIRVTYAAPADGEAAAALAAFAPHIAGETLADTLAAGEPAADAYQETVNLGGEPVSFGLSRVE
jgi:isoleucyl-tRNA synthetase